MNDKEWQLVPRMQFAKLLDAALNAHKAIQFGDSASELAAGHAIAKVIAVYDAAMTMRESLAIAMRKIEQLENETLAAPQPPETGRVAGEREAFEAACRALDWTKIESGKELWAIWKAARAATGSDEGASVCKWRRSELIEACNEAADALVGMPTRREKLYEAAKALAAPDPLREVCREVAGELQTWLDNYDPEGFGCACTPTRTCGTCQWRERQRPLIVLADKLRAALSGAGEG